MNFPESVPHGKDKRRLIRDFLTNTRYGSLIIGTNYVWNGANIPRILWVYATPFDPEYEVAVLAHDYLCDGGELCSGYVCTRKEADQVFFDLSLRYGVRPTRALVMWLAVRLWAMLFSRQRTVSPYDW